jgi:shikimate kinase
MSLVLIGLPRAGKTTLGKKLSQDLSLPFIDSDQLIEEFIGYSTRKLYQESPQKFREIETEVISSIKKNPPSVISLGGGAILEKNNHSLIKELGIVIYLEISETILWQRFLNKTLPAWISKENPKESFKRICKERIPIYEKLSDFKIIGKNNG